MAYQNPPYFISAYALACKRGFIGSLDDWLASLKGEKGDAGPGVVIKGRYASLALLQAAHETGSVGDYYAVGTSVDNQKVYYWDPENGWTEIHIRGEKGDTGNGIVSVEKTASVGIYDTYRITFDNEEFYDFVLKNGANFKAMELKESTATEDIYEVEFTDGAKTEVRLKIGKGVVGIVQVSGSHAAGTIDTYRITYNDEEHFDFEVYNGANGNGTVTTVAGIPVSGPNGDVPLILFGNGAPTTDTVGRVKQIYINQITGTLYICHGDDGNGVYSWVNPSAYELANAVSTLNAAIASETNARTAADAALQQQITDLDSDVDSIVQESAFEIAEEDGEYILYWYGAQGECPYSIEYEDGEYILYFEYETA